MCNERSLSKSHWCNICGCLCVWPSAPSIICPATFPPIVSGTEHRISPTGEVVVSWPYKESKIEVFRVADEKTATYDAGFPIENVAFSVSGRFLCITGYQVKSVQPTTSVSRVAVVDSENEFARTINLTGTRILEVDFGRQAGRIVVCPRRRA